jgi:ABC-type multidrug transport system ATPase subunit
MDALNGLRPAQKGLVLYNGQDYYSHLAAFSTQLGYVPQDDIIHRDLTVERALYYTAKMRLPVDFTEAQIKQRIDEVLEDVEIKHRRSLLVSKLSGGQRKRVSIALELLSNPSLFFLDEPTSGLDPGLDRKMMFLLRRLADKGHTIVLVTHATNNINACDYICFLAQGGRLAYFGPPNDAKAYFGKTDFAEIYSTLEPTEVNPNIPDEAENRFKASPDYQKYIVGPLNQGPAGRADANQQTVAVKPPKRGNPWKQFSLLSWRYLAILKNDKANLAILLLQAPLIGLLLLFFIRGVGPDGFNPNNVVQCPVTASIITNTGPDIPTRSNPPVSRSCQHLLTFLTTDSRGIAYANQKGGPNQALQDFIVPGPGFAPTVLFIMAFSAIFFGCINAAREIVKEAPIYRRERSVNLGILPYLFSKIVVLGILCLVQSAILVLCVSIPDPFSNSIFLPPVLEVYITIALTSLAGLMMGLMVSALVPNTDRAMSIVPLLLIPQVIFSGVIFPLNTWFLQLVAALFPIRWAMAALGSSIGLHSDKLNGDTLFGNIPTFHSTLFSTYSQVDAIQFLLLMWLALSIMIIVFGAATAYFLKRKDIRK